MYPQICSLPFGAGLWSGTTWMLTPASNLSRLPYHLASRWIWLPEDTSRRLESEGERRAKVFTLTPLPACPCPGSSGVCTYSAWARALTGLPEHRTGAPSDPEPPWFPLLLALRSPLSPGGSLNSAPTSSNHSLIKCSSATLVRVCHPSLFRLTGTMVFQNYKIQSLENI